MNVLALGADRIFDHEWNNLLQERVFTVTPPPPGPVRPVAEFEPASHVLIRYPLGIPTSLVAQLSNTGQVITIVGSTSAQNQATNSFQNAGVNMANVSFMIAPTDSYWTRDYGPWFVFDGNDSLSVVDFRYNRPRPNDDDIPSLFATQFDFDYYGMDLYQTGGNYMSDGLSSAAQTTIAYSENSSQTQAQVNQKMLEYLGISNYWVLPDPNNTYIDHIDCWGKFLAPDKVLIRSVPTTHAQYNAIEQTAAFFASQICAWGYPYKVYRVSTPQNQPYTNSYIFNNRVFVPQMNSSNDNQALQAYSAAMPGYEVVGVTASYSAPWESTDALHCRTHEIPDRQMLYVQHLPYHGEQQRSRFDFNVEIKAYSDQELYPDSLFVSYQLNGTMWQRSQLTNISGPSYTALLNGFAPGDTIRYFIHAADQSGRSVNHPIMGHQDPHIFWMTPDTTAPVIQHTELTEVLSNMEELSFYASVFDEYGVNQVSLEYQIDDNEIHTVMMENTGADDWTCIIHPNLTNEDEIFRYRIFAVDFANPGNYASYPGGGGWVQVLIGHSDNQDENVPSTSTMLKKIYPNPWNKSKSNQVSIEYSAPKHHKLSFRIFNLRGQLIKTLSTSAKSEGTNFIYWDGKDAGGKLSTSGVYIIQMCSGKEVSTRKIMLGI